MKFYRRHKHELNHTENDDPLPQAPEKKMRYSRADDVLLAKFFFNKPDGTSDKIFQAFGRLVSPLLTRFFDCRSIIPFSTHTTHGKVGRNTTGFISKRSTTSFNGSARAITSTSLTPQLSHERTRLFFGRMAFSRSLLYFVSIALVRTRDYDHWAHHSRTLGTVLVANWSGGEIA